MRSIDLVSMGFKNLWRRKLRTFLTILGVIIGTASIVIMVSLGFGMTEGFKEQVSQMGNLHVITVNPSFDYYGDSPSPSSRSGESPNLDDQAVANFSAIQGVQAVTPIMQTYMKMVSGRYVTYLPVKGILPETMEAFDFKVTEGRLLNSDDTLNLVFGSYIPHEFYNPKETGRRYYGGSESSEPKVNVLEDRLELTFDMSYGERRSPGSSSSNSKPPKVYKVSGVGLLESGNYENDYYAYMALPQLKKLIDENKRNSRGQNNSGNSKEGYEQIMVKVEKIDDVQRIQDQIKEMGYNAYSLNDMLESMQETASTLQAVLGGIGAVSLLVAALGITNTMIMSIYERTREIGIMKVIGAELNDIRRLFLLEAGIIGFSGGILGIGMSYSASYLLNRANVSILGMGMPGTRISIIPLWLALASICFSTVIGLLSGFYPARRAMKLSALEAIKTE